MAKVQQVAADLRDALFSITGINCPAKNLVTRIDKIPISG
jgi:hypothetical protein